MGRMLEALKHKELGRLGTREKPFLDDSIEHLPAADNGTSSDEGIPFIEVGPNKKVDGSPQVMAVKHAPQPRVQPPHQPVVAAPAAPTLSGFVQGNGGGRIIENKQPRPLEVAFEAWPSPAHAGQGIAADIITFHQPEHAISRQYGQHVAKLLDGEKAGGPLVLLLTGCRAQVGTSTVLLNLAAAAAQQGNGRVAVVDANCRRPSLAQRLGCTASAGLQDVLNGRVALEQAVLQTSIPGLHLLPAQQAGDARALKAEAVVWLFHWLGEHFNLVLVDGPALDCGSELSTLAAACDGTFLVVPDGESQQSQRGFAQNLSALGARVRGLFHTGPSK